MKPRFVPEWVYGINGNRPTTRKSKAIAVENVECNLGDVERRQSPRSVPCRRRLLGKRLSVGLRQDEPERLKHEPRRSGLFLGAVLRLLGLLHRHRPAQRDGLLAASNVTPEFLPPLIGGNRSWLDAALQTLRPRKQLVSETVGMEPRVG